jgi:ATP-dependent exoDNAse (exonuclease V) beta subunit
LIIEYARTHGSDISRFLDFWKETGHNKSVSAPSGQDAVRILTLHKSKGLEFKVTIIPYCNWELNTFNKSFLWCKPNEAPFDKLPVLPLSFTSSLGNTIFAEDFFKETNRQLIDNLNLLYVAFTRAQEALYVFCKDREEGSLKNVSDLTRKVLGKTMYTLGEPPSDGSTAMPIPTVAIIHKTVSLKDISNRVKIAFQGKLLIDPAVNKPSRPVNDGKILHEIFTFIKRREDIKFAVTRLQIQGIIAAEDQNRYIRFIEYAMNDLQVSTWFTGDWKILNEAEIILPRGEIKRPDRVMIKGNQTIVIDYKFGTKVETKYQTQVSDYARLLKDMGYPGVNAYLWYVKLGRVVDLKIV